MCTDDNGIYWVRGGEVLRVTKCGDCREEEKKAMEKEKGDGGKEGGPGEGSSTSRTNA